MSDDLDEWSENTDERMNRAQIATQTEPELLAAIDHRDHDTRLVYADWLETIGDLERAEFVRLQDTLTRPMTREAYREAFRRSCDIAKRTDMAWRVLVARPRIRNCWREDCPKEWGSLEPCERTDVRRCTTCVSRVPYCATLSEIHEHDDCFEPYVLDVINPDDEPTQPGVVLGPGDPFVGPDDPMDPDLPDDDGTVFSDEPPPWRTG